MKKSSPQLVLVFFFLFFLSSKLYAGNFSWTGTTSSSWTTSTNWSPTGVPSTNDTVTITNQTNNPQLSANTTVKKIIMTSGTLNLNTYTLTLGTYGNFNGGTINNGRVSVSVSFGSSSFSFNGTTFGAKVNLYGTVSSLINSTFNDSLVITQVGAPLNGKGGNTFNSYACFESSLSSIVLSDSLPDIFNATLEIITGGVGSIYIAHRGAGNQFNGNVKLTGPNIYSNYYGTATFSQNISIFPVTMKGKKRSSVYFGYSTGSSTLASGKTISIDTSIQKGSFYFQNFTQNGSGNMNFHVSDSVHFYFKTGTTFNASLTCYAPFIHLDGARFLSTTSFTNNATLDVTSLGGCYFGGQTTIINNSSATKTFSLGNTVTDTFATATTIQNNTGLLSINNAIFDSNVSLINNNTSTTTNTFILSNTGQCRFKGALTIDNPYSAMLLAIDGETILDDNATVCSTVGSTGTVVIKNTTQYGNCPFNFPYSTSKLILDGGNTFNGNFIFDGQNIEVKGTTFNGDVYITKYGSTDNTWYGGNVFNGTTTIRDLSTSGHFLKMGNSASDTYNGNVIFKQMGAGILYPAYNYPIFFNGNVTIDSSSAITFGSSSGKVIFNGTTNQSVNKSTSTSPEFKKLQVNKSAGKLNLNCAINIQDSLILTNGIINTTESNIITLLDNAKSYGGSNATFIDGYLKKIGNDAFQFPLGSDNFSSGKYHPLQITQPSDVTESYIAKYFSTSSNITDLLDSISISNCHHWTLKHSGNNSVKVSLGIEDESCLVQSKSNALVLSHNGSTWTKLGKFNLEYLNETNALLSANIASQIPSNSEYVFTIGEYTIPQPSAASQSNVLEHPRGLYVSSFITLYTDGSTMKLDLNKSILGIDNPGGTPDGIYEKEEEVLNYAFENRFTYLILYDMGALLNNGLQSNNLPLYNFLIGRLCEFMRKAKSNYCVSSFGAAGFKEDFFETIEDYNANAIGIPPFALNTEEKSLFGNNSSLIDLIESTSIDPNTDDRYYYQQLLRYTLGMARLNTTSPCIDFDVLNIEYEYWNETDDGDNLDQIDLKWQQLTDGFIVSGIEAYLKSLDDIATPNNLLREIYLGYLWDYDDNIQDLTVTQEMDGTFGNPTSRRLDRILLHFYTSSPQSIFSGGNPYYVPRLSLFKNSATIDKTDIHPIFSSEEKDFLGAGDDFQGQWFLNPPSLSPTELYVHNIYSAEKLFYDNWRTTATLSNNSENDIRPDAFQWFTSKYMIGQLENPIIFYTNDAPRCTSSPTVAVQFKYQGTLEEGLDYTFEVRNNSGTIIPPTIITAQYQAGTSGDYAVTYPTTNLMLPTYDLATTSNPAIVPYKATLSIAKSYSIPNNNSCNYSYSCTRDIWVGDATPEIQVNGNFTFDSGTEEYSICKGEPVYLSGNVSNTLNWFKVPSTPIHTGNIFVPTESGEYYYVKASGTSCLTSSTPVKIIINDNPKAQITSTCTPNTNNVLLTASTGDTYHWHDGSTNNTFQATSSSTYTVTINQSNGCSRVASISVPGRPGISYVTNGCDYILQETDLNGSADYIYEWFRLDPATNQWNPVPPGPTTSNVCTTNVAGVYRVIISKNNICRTSNSLPIGFAITNSSITQPTCNGGSNGSISLSIFGTISSYAWSPGGQSTQNISSLPANTYVVTLTSSTGCTSTASFTLSNSNLVVGSTSTTNVSCFGASTGSASVNSSCPSCTYSWSTTPVQTLSTASNLSAGTYVVTVTNGTCTGTKSITINQPSKLQSFITTISQANCYNGTGNVTAIAYGGTGPSYTYSWSGSGITTATNASILAGSSTVTVTDNVGCSTTSSVVISQPTQIIINSTSSDATCVSGYSNGTASVMVSGGTPSYNYLWSPSGGTSNIATGLSPGSYTCTVTDNNGCSATSSSIVIIGVVGYSLTTTTNPTSCVGLGAVGTATVTPTPSSPNYTYAWEPLSYNQTTPTASALDPGSYTVTVSINGCSLTATATVNNNSLPYDLNPSPIINQTITWTNTNKKISGSIDILNGGELIISGCTVEFSYELVAGRNSLDFYEARIRVSPGGKLTVINSTLTGCDGGVWDGIEMIGNKTVNQSQTGSIKQPKVSITDNSIIENAYIGLSGLVYNYFYEAPDIQTIPMDQSGGIFVLEECTLRNNKTAIRYQSYQHELVSTINDCIFTYDNNSPFKNDYTISNPMKFLELYGNKGLKIANTTFTSSVSNIDASLRGTGIRGVNVGIKLQDFSGTGDGNNVFNNLTIGIHLVNYMSTYSNQIEGNDFNGVYKGIYVQNGGPDNFKNNTFNVPAISGNVDKAYGIHMISSNGFNIEKNNFYSSSSPTSTFGMAFDNSGGLVYDNRLLKGNNQYAFDRSIQTENNCGLLAFRCNEFQDPFQYSLAINSGTIKTQGVGCGNHVEPAGNKWIYSQSCTGQQNLYHPLGGVFIYFAHQFDVNTQGTTIPTCRSSSTFIDYQQCTGLQELPNSCADPNPHLPPRPQKPPLVPYQQFIADFEGFTDAIDSMVSVYNDLINNDPDNKSVLGGQIKMLAYEKVFQASEKNDIEATKQVFDEYNFENFRKRLAEIHLFQEDLDSLEIVLDEIENDTLISQEERDNYVILMSEISNAMDSNGTIILDSLSVDLLTDVAESETNSAYQAEILLQLIADEYPLHDIPDLNSGVPRIRNTFFSKPLEELVVFPNPTNSIVYVSYKATLEGQKLDLRIYNMFGEQIILKPLTEKKATIELDLSSFSQGVYQIVITNSENTLFKDRIVVIK